MYFLNNRNIIKTKYPIIYSLPNLYQTRVLLLFFLQEQILKHLTSNDNHTSSHNSTPTITRIILLNTEKVDNSISIGIAATKL